MAKITAPNKEFTGKRGNVAFVDGQAETDDPTMLAYFRRHGYKIGGKSSKSDKATEPQFPEGDASTDWTGEQLKAYAAAKDIDLGAAKTKSEMVAAIAAATD